MNKRRLYIVQSVAVLLLINSSSMVSGFCLDSTCTSTCLASNGTISECLSTCCAEEAESAQYVLGCHYQCVDSLQNSTEGVLGQIETYSECLQECTQYIVNLTDIYSDIQAGLQGFSLQSLSNNNNAFSILDESDCKSEDMGCLRKQFLKHTTALSVDIEEELTQIESATLDYIECMSACPPDAEVCIMVCVDGYSNSIRPVVALFNEDKNYNFENQYSFMTTQLQNASYNLKQCIIGCNDTDSECMNTCIDVYIYEAFFMVQLYSREQFVKLTADPLYLASEDPFVEYDKCKKGCGTAGNFECIALCNERLQRRLDEDTMSLLSASEFSLFQLQQNRLQSLFFNETEWWKEWEDQINQELEELEDAIEEAADALANDTSDLIDQVSEQIANKTANMTQLIDELYEEFSRIDNNTQEISKSLTFQALMSEKPSDMKQIKKMLEQEAKKRQVLLKQQEFKKINALRQVALQSFYNDINQLYSISDKSQSLADFTMDAENNRLLLEAQRTNNECSSVQCTTACLMNYNSFSEQSACFNQMCSCDISIMYKASTCDLECGLFCGRLTSNDGLEMCLSDCGCSADDFSVEDQLSAPSTSLFSLNSGIAAQNEAIQMSFIKKAYFVLMGIVAVISTIITLKNVKEIREKQNKKQRESKKIIKEKMIDHADNEESFVIEENYEKIM